MQIGKACGEKWNTMAFEVSISSVQPDSCVALGIYPVLLLAGVNWKCICETSGKEVYAKHFHSTVFHFSGCGVEMFRIYFFSWWTSLWKTVLMDQKISLLCLIWFISSLKNISYCLFCFYSYSEEIILIEILSCL